MKRSERMTQVAGVFGETERERARELNSAQQRLAQAEAKLVELRTYHGEYLGTFRQRAASGTGIHKLRDFQAFLARLEQALAQQEKNVALAREQVAGTRRNWQGAARQVKAVDAVVDRWQVAEKTALDRREQKDSDERAQRSAPRADGGWEAK